MFQLQQFYVNALIYYSLHKVVWQTKEYGQKKQ